MSLTFGIQGFEMELGLEIPCAACGVSLEESQALRNDTKEETLAKRTFHASCETCSGYGGPPDKGMPPLPFLLNVAQSAGEAVVELLGGGADNDEIEPDSVLRYRKDELALELSTLYIERGLYVSCAKDAGISKEEAESLTTSVAAKHAHKLHNIARKAVAYKRKIWVR